MRVTSKGQVTIPIEMRERYGILPESEVEFVDSERGPTIVPKGSEARVAEIKRALERMRGSSTTGLTTDEIMRMMRGEEWQSGR